MATEGPSEDDPGSGCLCWWGRREAPASALTPFRAQIQRKTQKWSAVADTVRCSLCGMRAAGRTPASRNDDALGGLRQYVEVALGDVDGPDQATISWRTRSAAAIRHSSSPKPVMKVGHLLTGVLAVLASEMTVAAQAPPEAVLEQAAQAKKVLLIGIDGCRFDALQKADTPYFDALIEMGSTAEPIRIFPRHYREADTISGPGGLNIRNVLVPARS